MILLNVTLMLLSCTGDNPAWTQQNLKKTWAGVQQQFTSVTVPEPDGWRRFRSLKRRRCAVFGGSVSVNVTSVSFYWSDRTRVSFHPVKRQSVTGLHEHISAGTFLQTHLSELHGATSRLSLRHKHRRTGLSRAQEAPPTAAFRNPWWAPSLGFF